MVSNAFLESLRSSNFVLTIIKLLTANKQDPAKTLTASFGT